VKVSWDQVHAWRLRRQFLDPLGDADAADVVGRLCGVQAQVASSPSWPYGSGRPSRKPQPWSAASTGVE